MTTLRRIDGSFEIPARLPVIPVRNQVLFPYLELPLRIARRQSLASLEAAESAGGLLLTVAQRDEHADDVALADLHGVGTVVRVRKVKRLANNVADATLEGLGRARMTEFRQSKAGFRASVDLLSANERDLGGGYEGRIEARAKDVFRKFREYVDLSPEISVEVIDLVSRFDDLVRGSHLVASHLRCDVETKQGVLEETELGPRLLKLYRILDELVRFRAIDEAASRLADLAPRGRGPGRRAMPRRKDRAATKGHLETEWDRLAERIAAADLPDRARRVARRELSGLREINPTSPEVSVRRTYLERILELPWNRETVDCTDVGYAARVLDREHYGMAEVKGRILDQIAVRSLVGGTDGWILCLVGPPGVGKTSIGRSIALCLKRKFQRLSLGGVNDDSVIRGHRRTYVSAMPGRIIKGLRDAGSRNPVFLLDEIDKLQRGSQGDPGAALLEVLDPEQNNSFTDMYLDVEFDLSKVLFVTTANTLAGLPAALRDRMEVIRVPGYLDTEKLEIARRFLWPRLVESHGLKPFAPAVSDDALKLVISSYTREAGVRQLDRSLRTIAQKLARKVAEDKTQRRLEPVGPGDLRTLLGPAKRRRTRRDDGEDRRGIACGLAWTEVGGEVMEVEVAVVPGRGEIKLTGTLGDVLKESAEAAITYAVSRARLLGLNERFHHDIDVHVHIPGGATPKDGPSAGITIAAAVVSALTDRPTRTDLAMTGEITLRGRVLAVDGIKEKLVAALRDGIERVLLPAENESDIEQLPEEVLAGLKLIPVKTVDEVLSEALSPDAAGGGNGRS